MDAKPRETCFSQLKCSAVKAAEVLERTVKEEKISISTQPGSLEIYDYHSKKTPSLHTIKVINFSKHSIKFKLEPPKSKYFQIDKQFFKDDDIPQNIAPGMHWSFFIKFHPPIDNFGILKDKVLILLEDGREHSVPLFAYTEKSVLGLPSKLDFGTVFSISKNGSKTDSEKDEYWQESDTRYIDISNKGSKDEKVDLIFDKTLPIRITPTTFTVNKNSTIQLKVQLLPYIIGNFSYEIQYAIIPTRGVSSEYGLKKFESRTNPWPLLEKSLSQSTFTGISKTLKPISENSLKLVGNVVYHKIRMLSAENDQVLIDPENLHFGVIYEGEKAHLPGSTPLQWILTYSEEITPNVPTDCIFELNDQKNNTANSLISISPSEGTILPFESNLVTLEFSPLIPVKEKGFLTERSSILETSGSATDYKVPMKLSILNRSNQKSTGEEPINFIVSGKSCPLLAKLSKTEIEFENADLGKYTEEEVEIRNDSSQLGFKFEFQKVSQFLCHPKQGKLGPLQKVKVKLTFKPNQLGTHRKKLECIISSMQNKTQISMTEQNLSKRNLFISISGTANILSAKKTIKAQNISKEVAECDISLLNEVKKSYSIFEHESNSEKISVSISGKKENPEWKSKIENRDKYISYIRGLHETRIKSKKDKYFGNDGVSIKFADIALNQQYQNVDVANGLLVPELEVGYTLDNLKKVQINEEDLNRNNYQQKIVPLFEKLFEKVVHVAKETTTPDIKVLSPKQLSQEAKLYESLQKDELSRIYVSLSSIDLGNITVHSINMIPINFLNGINSGKSVNISILKADNLEANVAVIPDNIEVPRFQVVGVAFSFQSHTPGKFSINVPYLVNGRYMYMIKVTANVTKISLKCDTNNVLINIKCTDIIQNHRYGTPGKQTDISQRPTTADTDNSHDLEKSHGSNQLSRFFGETVIKIINEGNHEARFAWKNGGDHDDDERNIVGKSAALEQDGYFNIYPKEGVVSSRGSFECKITFLPGIKYLLEEDFKLDVIDAWDKNSPMVVDTIPVRFQGEIPACKCVLLTSLKQGPLDLGALPVGFTTIEKLKTDQPNLQEENYSFYTLSLFFSKFNKLSWADFGDSPSFNKKKKARTIKIKNSSPNLTAYVASIQSGKVELELSSTEGFISGNNGLLELIVSALPTRIGVCEETVVINIAGSGRSYKIPVRYEGKMSEISVEEDEEVLGDQVLIGSWGTKTFTIHNKGSVSSRSVIDLRIYPDFRIRPKPISLTDVGEKPNATRQISLENSGYLNHSQMPGKKSSISVGNKHAKKMIELDYAEINLPGFTVIDQSSPHFYFDRDQIEERKKAPTSEGEIQTLGNLYALDLLPGEKADLQIVFKPIQLKKYDFDLPIRVLGNPVPIFLKVSTESIPSPLTLSRSNINFQNKVIFRGGATSGSTYISSSSTKEVIQLKNCSSEKIVWWFDSKNFDDVSQTFRIEPSQGSILPHESASVSVVFRPDIAGKYTVDALLNVDKMGAKFHFSLSLQGTGVEPSLALDPPEVFLPIVPLGETTMSTFSIVNHGCERTELTTKFSESILKYGTLEVLFPEGNLLKSDGEKLKVAVKFTSKVPLPVSFVIKIKFEDHNGNILYLHVHGTSDSSFLSLQSFLHENKHALLLDDSKESVAYEFAIKPFTDANEERVKILSSTQAYSTPAGVPLENNPSDYIDYFYENLGNSLMRWLGDHINIQLVFFIIFFLKKKDASRFPSQLIASDGRAIFDCIYSLSGKKVSGLVSLSALCNFFCQSTKKKIAAPQEEKIKYLYKQYVELLSQLECIGGMMSTIKPEHLFSDDDFKRFNRQLNDNAKSHDHNHVVFDEERWHHTLKTEKYFSIVSKEAWAILLLQIVKCFLTTNVSSRTFKSLVGFEVFEKSLVWPTSVKCNRIYSVSDNVLLKWSSYHVFKQTSKMIRLIRFSSDFSDSLAIMSILSAHFPKLKTTTFLTFELECTTVEQKIENSNLVKTALNNIFPSCDGIKNFPMEKLAKESHDIGIEIYMLLLFLFQSLPQFLVSTDVDFEGALHEPTTKYIDLTNPGNQTVIYTTDIPTKSDFKILTSDGSIHVKETGINANKILTYSFQVPAHGVFRLLVEFVSRFSKEVEETITLKSKKMGLNSSSILVFLLKGGVTSSSPKKIINLESSLFNVPPVVNEIIVTNPFAVKGKFKIKLSETTQQKIPKHEAQIKSPKGFCIFTEEIVLLPGESKKIDITFVPFTNNLYEGILYFLDENVGEFFYRIEGKNIIPQPSEVYNWACRAYTSLEKVIRIAAGNSLREKAVHFVVNQKNQSKEHHKVNEEKIIKFHLPKVPMKYKVEYSSQYFKGPSEITISPPKELSKESGFKFGLERDDTELPVTFNPKLPGKYACKIALYGNDGSDVRVFQIFATAISQGSVAELEFCSPARVCLIQDIPFSNQTKDEWILRASFTGNLFSGPSSVTVPPGAVVNFPACFTPIKPGEFKGSLTIFNINTTQKHNYHLKGIGLEPLPEETIEINCNNREKFIQTFTAKNFSDQDAEFEVLSNIQSSIGPSLLKIPRNEKLSYDLEISPTISGNFTKQIYFINKTDSSYSWYLVQLNIRPPPKEDTIKLTAQVRKVIETEFRLSNPLDTNVVYSIIIEGVGLKGEKTFEIEAGGESVYKLAYNPMVSQRQSGSIKFVTQEIGEFWYELLLEAIESAPISLPDMTSPLGKSSIQSIVLENPSNEDLLFETTLTNKRDFRICLPTDIESVFDSSNRQISLTNVKIAPHSSIDLNVVFWPSSVTEQRSTGIQFSSRVLGNIVYNVRGQGTLPEVMDEVVVGATIGDVSSSVLVFTNPLIDPILVSVDFVVDDYVKGGEMRSGTKEEGTENEVKAHTETFSNNGAGRKKVFSMINNKKTKFHIGSLDKLEIPFTFSPKNMVQQKTKIVVELNSKLRWVYPIKGIPEAHISTVTQVLESRVREQTTTDFELLLPKFCTPINKSGEQRDWKLLVDFKITDHSKDHPSIRPKETLSVTDEVITLLLLETRETPTEDHALVIKFRALFSPTKIAHKMHHILIENKESGGCWRFPLKLMALPPPMDDTITIEGTIGKFSSISFSLKNSSGEDKQFNAFFTPDSPGEFSVSPTSGVLVPSKASDLGGDNKFVIGYRPTSYGKTLIGTLVIETEGSFWSYEIRGVPPLYQQPRTTSGRMSNRNQSQPGGAAISIRDIRSSSSILGKQNFIKKNASSFSLLAKKK